MTKTALGRGFDGLIPVGFNVDEVAVPGESIKQIAIDKIHINPDQPRKHFDDVALEELASSIKQHGIIQPLVVTPVSDGYRIVAGERRYRASKLAKLAKLPVIVRNHQELEELEIALVENVQRVDLSPLEQALSIVRLRDQFSLTPKDIAKKLGKAETTISNTVRLLQLTKRGIEALSDGRISEGHARALLALKADEQAQEQLLNEIEQKKYSVREAEQWVQNWKKQREQKNNSTDTLLVNRLTKLKKSGLKIAHRQKKTGGQIIVDYKTQNELDTIIKAFEAES
ncbi:MAG TPA: ParB/RepB/Spo0J family partition protein [Candidatus Saccharibacteria bacterium]|jgi:ParB family chromosome partitioning protein|nr:ParB/RepB/Spo0J family partition protein [Candidatus Saccharibacteria bacterium]